MPSRRSPRLPTHDYRLPGWYFVTICTRRRALLFGEVIGGSACLSAEGQIAHDAWLRTFNRRPYLVPDAFVVMPDHVHLLFGLMPDGDRPGDDARFDRSRDMARHVPTARHAPAAHVLAGGGAVPGRAFTCPPGRSVSAVIGGYKSYASRTVGRLWGVSGAGLWQGRFYDRIVRSDAERDRIRRYIDENPVRWHLRHR